MIPPWNWHEFMEELKQQLPDFDQKQLSNTNMDFNWIEDYVKKSLEKTLWPNVKPQEKKRNEDKVGIKQDQNDYQHKHQVHSQVLELHKYIIVKLILPSGLNPRRLRLSVHPYLLKWRILPDKKHNTIPLPAAVQTKGVKAIYENRVMEISMKKSGHKEHFEELNPLFKD